MVDPELLPEGVPRCRRLRRHRWERIEDPVGLRVRCRRCGWGWFEPRLFVVDGPECDGCGADLVYGVVHDCPVLGVEVLADLIEV